jgi:hypothetical protein
VPPALESPVVDLQLAASLAAPRTDAWRWRSRTVPPTPSLVSLTACTDAPGRWSSRLDAVVTRTLPSCVSRSPSQPPASYEGGASLAFCATSANFSAPRGRLKRAPNAAFQAPLHPQVECITNIDRQGYRPIARLSGPDVLFEPIDAPQGGPVLRLAWIAGGPRPRPPGFLSTTTSTQQRLGWLSEFDASSQRRLYAGTFASAPGDAGEEVRKK